MFLWKTKIISLLKAIIWSFRITSTDGDWSGNIYDFYYRITFKLTEDIAVPFKMSGMFRDDSSPMKKAIREALCNTLSNADYHGGLGLVIKQYHDKIVFSNPGILAMPLNKILLGGESKARNRTILNIFSFANIGERAGSGYALILNATKKNNYPTPELYDDFNPDVTKLTIFIQKPISQGENLGNNISIPNIIDELNVKQDVKDNLKKLYNFFVNEIFGKINIQKQLEVNKNTSTSYIKTLIDSN